MHDEISLIAKGTVRFHIPRKPDPEAKMGDYVVVPIRAPHTFSNPGDEEARIFNTFTPAFYINYSKLLSSLAEEGKPVTPEMNREAMKGYATIPVEN
ncbi:MAG: hypothetical protein M1834_008043 [Cirrosporium novae-zelandiae]|nr:MAG: hypothetical protein M1834_008043 [Cirrosporium novae-zelandiae]